MPRRHNPPSQTWRTFLANHIGSLACIDFLTVPTATLRVLYVFLVLSVARRRVVHWNVTSGASAEWAAQQIVDAFPENTAPRYLLRDRDGVYYKGPRLENASPGLASKRSSPRPNPLGRIHSRSASWAPFGVTASTTSSCSAKPTYARSSSRTSRTTTERARTSPWAKTRRTRDRSSRPVSA
jgi:hypothetical protein